MPRQKLKIDRDEALQTATRIVDALDSDGIRCMICGAIRRGLPTVNDVDIVVQSTLDIVETVIASACNTLWNFKYGPINRLPTPNSKSFTCLIDGIQFSFMATVEESWGAMVMHYTGNQFFNVMMRVRAKKLGYKLNEKGLWHREEQIAGRSEEQIFKALMIKYMEPEERNIKRGDYLPVEGPVLLKDNLDKETEK